jgi:hypothetical protein
MPTTYEKTNNHDPIYDSNIIKEIDDFFKTKIATMHSK